MKKITKISISGIIVIVIFIGFSSIALAANPPLEVTFGSTPLFSVSNFMPGDEKEGDITIGNNGDSSQNAYVEAVNVFNDDGLASQMELQILEDLTEIYNDNFETFLNAGPVSLSSIGTSDSKIYTLKISFIENADNDYQGKSLGFDVCVGFSGGEFTCTDTVTVSPENPPGGGGGGGSSGSRHLTVFNENALNIEANGTIPGSGSATIIWETNIPATSQVIYGLASEAPHPFDMNIPPKFGYPSVNTEDLTKKISHSMFISGLTPGETYVYRVVSRASPATVSYEHEFTVPIPSEAGNIITSGSLGISGEEGSVLGASDDTSKDEGVSGIFDTKNLAAAVTTGWSDLLSNCSIIALLILLVAYLVWRFVLKSKYEKQRLPENKIKEKFFTLFGSISGVSIIIALLLGQICPIPIFVIALILSIAMCIYYRYFSDNTV